MNAMDIIKSNQVRELLISGKREDAREPMQMRPIKITPNMIQNAEGSAHVEIGSTKVLVGIKMEVGEPMTDTPEQGNLMVGGELLPLASSEFETGPPSPESIELARVTDRGIRSAECIDLTKLFIEEGKVWSVFIDIYVLDAHGNLFDASGLAAMAALMNTNMPKYEDNKVVRERGTRLKLHNTVTYTTFSKIANTLILDADRDEENASDARLTIATDAENVRAIQKGLGGSFSPSEVDQLATISLEKHKELKRLLDSAAE